MKALLPALSLWIGLLAAPAFGFDILPEYQGLSETDLLKFEKPTDIDSEYQIVVNAFTFPLEWERAWHKSPKGIDLSIGSLSNKHFYHYSRAKFEAALTDSFSFHFNAFSQRDRETDQVRHVLELSQQVAPALRVNIYGEPSLYKRENDFGFALVASPGSWQHRLYYTLHDLTRAEHNDLADRFTKGRDPRALGWSVTGDAGPLWLRAGFRYDQPVTWLRPQEGRIFSYNKRLAFADALWTLSPNQRAGVRLQWDETFKGQDKETPASAVVPESWKVERLFARFSYMSGTPEDIWNYEVALMHAERRWTDINGSSLTHYNELPSVALNFRSKRRGDVFDHVRVEYEVGYFRRFGELQLAPTQKHAPAEHRLMTGYEWSFAKNARLLLALNFDADEWTPAPTFEGGNGLFRAEF